jgi:hypothetical protein
MFFKYFNLKKNNLNDQSLTFYKEIVNHSNIFIKNQISDENLNFNDVFEIFTIVTIFYLKKLKDKNTTDSKIISQEIIDSFVRDLDQHFREQGIGDMSIGKYVKKYVKKFYYRLKILDAVFENNKELDINEYLYKIDTLPKENIDQISSNLKELYNRILI